jgi:hypothetical protein
LSSQSLGSSTGTQSLSISDAASIDAVRAQKRILELEALVGPCLEDLETGSQDVKIEALARLFHSVHLYPQFSGDNNDIILKGIIEDIYAFSRLLALLKAESPQVRAQAASLITFTFDYWVNKSGDVPAALAYSMFLLPAVVALVQLLDFLNKDSDKDYDVVNDALKGLCPAVSAHVGVVLAAGMLGKFELSLLPFAVAHPNTYLINTAHLREVLNRLSLLNDGATAIKNNHGVMTCLQNISGQEHSFSYSAGSILDNVERNTAPATAHVFHINAIESEEGAGELSSDLFALLRP